jgi:GxxExxY protein
MDIEGIAREIVDSAFHIHTRLGPGLLESVYQVLLANALERRGLRVRRQMPVDFTFDGVRFREGFKVDLLVEDVVVVELKSVERLAPVHMKQTLTYLRLLDLNLALLINFGAATMKEGLKRVVNDYHPQGEAARKPQPR